MLNSNYLNKKLLKDCWELFHQIPNNSLNAVFFDPQYRGVLDYLLLGNEGKSRQKERAELPAMDNAEIGELISVIEEKLVPSGYMFWWIDKFHLLQHDIQNCLQTVDMITWDKGKMGMGYRSRSQSEFLIVCQKKPIKAKATWTDHSIRDVWQEKIEEKIHVHQKPKELMKRLILATTKEGDLICDPCAGSFVVLECCQETNRNFIGCDIVTGTE